MMVADGYRRSGTPVTFKAYLGATHDSILSVSVDDVATWLAKRFAEPDAR
jgi:hypothetical protein